MTMRAWRNPEEDVELPIWHPAHPIHMRHLDFCAQLVMRRCSMTDVEDFLVGVAEVTPRWADAMLRPIVEHPKRRAIVQRALANTTKKTASPFERALLFWNVDADTDVDGVIEDALRLRQQAQTHYQPGSWHELEASPYLSVVFGLTDRDVAAANRSHIQIPYRREPNICEVVFINEIDSFFNELRFIPDLDEYQRRAAASRNYSWGRVSALWGEHDADTDSSHAFIQLLHGGGDPDLGNGLLIKGMYRAAQEELARVTVVVSFYYAMYYRVGGKISRAEMAPGEARARRSKRGGRFRDVEIADVAKFHADIFGVT